MDLTTNVRPYSMEAVQACLERTGNSRSCYIETYGCQMNVRDSETLYGLLELCGFHKIDRREEADLVLFNTCCIRDHAEQRVFGNLGQMREYKLEKPGRILGVCGCMVQQEEIAKRIYQRFPFVDIIMGTHVQHHLPEFLLAVLNGERILAIAKDEKSVIEGLPSVRPASSSAFVNINFGCNNYCTYCIVPYVRGPERSRRMGDILTEAKALAASGRTEITLLGQNVNSYGLDLGTYDFADLLRETAKIEGLRRIRYMTSHPKDLTDKLIETMANTEKVCHHVHLPMQSGSNAVLKRMNRKYTREHYLDIVRKLKCAMPDVELTTDIIVGFPGETEQDFLDTLSIVSEVGFATAFTFMYSPRQGTPAARMTDQIDAAVMNDRLQRLNALQAERTYQNNAKYIGHVGEVLVEGYDEKTASAYGKYANFKMVSFPAERNLVGQYVTVRAERVRGNSLGGRQIEETI